MLENGFLSKRAGKQAYNTITRERSSCLLGGGNGSDFPIDRGIVWVFDRLWK